MPNFQTYYHLKLDVQKVVQHTGGKWLIHDTKRCTDNQLHGMGCNCYFCLIHLGIIQHITILVNKRPEKSNHKKYTGPSINSAKTKSINKKNYL